MWLPHRLRYLSLWLPAGGTVFVRSWSRKEMEHRSRKRDTRGRLGGSMTLLHFPFVLSASFLRLKMGPFSLALRPHASESPRSCRYGLPSGAVLQITLPTGTRQLWHFITATKSASHIQGVRTCVHFGPKSASLDF